MNNSILITVWVEITHLLPASSHLAYTTGVGFFSCIRESKAVQVQAVMEKRLTVDDTGTSVFYDIRAKVNPLLAIWRSCADDCLL